MGVYDSLKNMVRGGDNETPIQEIDEAIENAEIRNQIETDDSHIESHLDTEPVTVEIPDVEPEQDVPEGTTYSERSAKGKLKTPGSVKMPIPDLLSKSEESAQEAKFEPKPRAVNNAPEAEFVSKAEYEKREMSKETPKERGPEEPYVGAIREGRIKEDQALEYLKKEYKLSNEDAQKEIQSILHPEEIKTTGPEFVPPPMEKGVLNSLGEALVERVKSKKFKSGSELLGNATANIKGETGITGSDADLEYAIKGGYSGLSRTALEADVLKYETSIEGMKVQMAENRSEILKRKNKVRDIEELRSKTKVKTEREQYTSEIKVENDEIHRLEMQNVELQRRIDKAEDSIRDKKGDIDKYNRAVLAGKKASSTRSKVREELKGLSKNAFDIQSGVFSAGISTKKDWFGKQGFLSQPFKQENITRSAVEPVKVSTRNLDYVTRSTGGSVGRDVVSVTAIKPSRNVAPLGAPGTIYGAKQQFDYNIPVKRISLSEVSGKSKGGNINPDILPSLYDNPRPAQIIQPQAQQYKQVVQEDGSIINVPVPTQSRKSKIFTISVNRYSHRVQYPTKSNGRIESGLKAIGIGNMLRGVDTFKPSSNGTMASIKPYRGSTKIGTVKLLPSLDIGIDTLKDKRGLVKMTLGKRPEVKLGLISPKQTTYTFERDGADEMFARTNDRVSKKSDTLVKMGANITGVKFNKNLKKIISKNKLK